MKKVSPFDRAVPAATQVAASVTVNTISRVTGIGFQDQRAAANCTPLQFFESILADDVVDLITMSADIPQCVAYLEVFRIHGVRGQCLCGFELGHQYHVACVVDVTVIDADLQVHHPRYLSPQGFECVLHELTGCTALGRALC